MKIKNHNQINNGKKQASTTDSPAQKYSKIGVRNQNNNKPKIAQHQDKQNIPYFSNKKTDQLIEKKQTENIKSLKNSRINEEVNAVDQYQKQIIKYIKSTQYKYQISNNYLRNMDNITHQHRATFVKHFFKVGKKFQLKRNTIYLAVYYMDAYFAKNPHIQKKQAIITAQACLFIATKYQQIYPPDLYEWTHATKQIVLAESLILKDLDFTLTYTTTQNYLDYYFKKLDLPQKDKDMIRLISDVSLFDQSMYIYGSAELAVSILYSIVNRSKLEEKVQMSLKWMIQRNEKYMEWLQTMQACKSKHI